MYFFWQQVFQIETKYYHDTLIFMSYLFSVIFHTTLDHLSWVVSDKFSFIDVREYNISSGSSFVKKITDNSDDGE